MLYPTESESSHRDNGTCVHPTASPSYSLSTLRGRDVSVALTTRLPGEKGIHEHDQVEICILFQSALGILSWRDSASQLQTCEIGGPCVVVLAAGLAHTWEWKESADVLGIWADRSLFERVTTSSLPDVSVIGLACSSEEKGTLWQFADTLRALIDQSDPALFFVESIASALASWLLYSIDMTQAEPTEPRPGLTASEFETVIQHMQMNLKYEIHVVDLARKIGRSIPHFAELFKNTTGQPPYEYLTQLRMLKAYELLLTGSRTVREAAREVGFTDSEHFTEKFQRYLRCSPRQVLRNARLESVNHRLFSANRPERS